MGCAGLWVVVSFIWLLTMGGGGEELFVYSASIVCEGEEFSSEGDW